MKISTSNRGADIMSLGVNVSSQSGKVSPQKDFKSYMNDTNESDSVSSVERTNKSEDIKRDNFDDANDVQEVNDNEPVDQTNDVKDKDLEQGLNDVKSENQVSEMKEMTDANQDFMNQGGLTEEDLTAVVELLASIQNMLQQMLGLNADEFNKMLEEQNMQISDLLLPEQRQQFLLAANNATPIDLLTNEGLANLLEQVQQSVEALISDSEISSDVIQTVMENAIEQVDMPVDDMNIEEQGDGKMNLQKTDIVEDNSASSHIQVTVETDSQTQMSEQNAASSNQSFEDAKAQIVNQVTQNVAQAINQVEGAGEVSSAEILRQVVEEIKLVAKQDVKSMEMQLYPEHLGKVTIEVSTRNGAVTAQITAENEAARAALESGIQVLRETFIAQEIKVEAIEVMVATPDFSQNDFLNKEAKENSDDKSTGNRRPINLEEFLEDEENLTEEEQIQVEMMKAEGRNVDYTA